MTLQYRDIEPGYTDWRNYKVDSGKTWVTQLAQESQENREWSGTFARTACVTNNERSRYFQLPSRYPER